MVENLALVSSPVFNLKRRARKVGDVVEGRAEVDHLHVQNPGFYILPGESVGRYSGG